MGRFVRIALALCLVFSQVDAKRVLGVRKQRVTAPPTTGLIWGSNGDGSTMFRFIDANLQPFYPATYILKVNHVQQAGYYTHFFWGWKNGGDFTASGFYGCHPYPKSPPSGNTHWWEVSEGGTDHVIDDNGNNPTVTYGDWYTQVVRVYPVGTTLKVEYYWDWATSTSRRITGSKDDYLTPASPAALTIGDAPWNQNSEMLSGTVRGFQFYDDTLTLADVATEIASPMSTAAGIAAIWYLNINPTPSDIADKSGQGHHPEWVGSNRPTLYSP